MGTEIGVAFADIEKISSQSMVKLTIWKRYVDEIFFLWDMSKSKIP